MSEEGDDGEAARTEMPSRYQQACNALCTAAQSARAAPMQPRANREKERQKYYALLQLAQGGHPLPCSTLLTTR